MLIGYTGVAGFFALESSSRKDAAMDYEQDTDRGTTRDIVVANVTAAVTAPILAALPQPRLSAQAALIGVAVQGTGLTLRRSDMEALAGSYTRTLRTTDEQHLVEAGPYRLIRHPGYLASILIWLGFALTSRSPIVVAFVAALIGRAYLRRIEVEEALLEREIPHYASYRRRTSRLIPFIW